MSVSVPRRLRLPLALVACIAALAVVVPLLPLDDPTQMSMGLRLTPPDGLHPLGRDEFGRDVMSRILWGVRVSLAVAVLASVVAAAIGTLLGLIGGYFRGVAELLTVRASEVVLSLPPLLLALLVVALLGPGAPTLIVCLGVLYAPGFAWVAFSETLSVRALDYVAAQDALGVHPARIMVRTVLPNVLPPLIVQFSLTLATALVIESGLSFLGLGVVPPAPSWGLMIRGARSTMDQAPLLLVWLCVALGGTVVILNMLCDRLRDVLDPRLGQGTGRRSRQPAVARLLPGLAADDMPHIIRLQGLTLGIAGLTAGQPLVRDVSFTVHPGETLALVGESGSGKTLTSLALMGLLPPGLEIVDGQAGFVRRDGTEVDLLTIPEHERRALRGNQVSMIFQDPGSSLNPVQPIGAQVAEAIRVHRATGRSEAIAEAVGLLDSVGLPDPARRACSYPHELSGGQKQRTMIASAIANQPRLLIADEPTTALDVTIQAQILTLLETRKRQASGMGMIFVTHNLAVVAEIADRVCIMYAGEVVEEGPAGVVFALPRHPYTAALLASVPKSDAARLTAIPGVVPQAHQLPQGCRFASRCSLVTERCRIAPPAVATVGERHVSRCLHWDKVR